MNSSTSRDKFLSLIIHLLFLFAGVMGVISCVKNDIQSLSNNIVMSQSFSVPLGSKTLSVQAPSVYDTSSTPGIYGTFYYNGLPYPLNATTFPPIYDTVNLNIAGKAQSSWIQRLTFSIVCENGYPANATLQVNLLNAGGGYLDQVFGNNPLLIEAATTDANGNVVSPTEKITQVVYEGTRLELLKQTRVLQYEVVISASSAHTIRITDADKFKVTMGARIELLYNLNNISR